MEKDGKKRGFTLVELMVVILIVGVLAAATAGTIRTAVRIYYTENPVGATAMAGSTVDTVQETLGFTAGDLTGRYFQASNFTISAVDGNGHATITVAAPAGLSGSGQLDSAGGWVYTP